MKFERLRSTSKQIIIAVFAKFGHVTSTPLQKRKTGNTEWYINICLPKVFEAWKVTSFNYLGSVITHEGSKPEILSRITQTTAALTRLKPVWIDNSISLSSKIRLMHSLVTSIFPYACESWTLTAELQRRIQAMEMRCYRKILHILYKDHVTNEEVVPRSRRQLDHMKIS